MENFMKDLDFFDIEGQDLMSQECFKIMEEVNDFSTKEGRRYINDVLHLKRGAKPIFLNLVGKGLISQIFEILELKKLEKIPNISLCDFIYDIKCYESIIDLCIHLYLYGDKECEIIKKINSTKLDMNTPRESFVYISKLVKPFINRFSTKQICFVDFTIEDTHLQLFYGLNSDQ